ncbi:MAG: Cysteine desulfurase IscS [Chlamydiae bacterium]|nr:Cysteine desulfurase IscS [Chlamydiota bacterium]
MSAFFHPLSEQLLEKKHLFEKHQIAPDSLEAKKLIEAGYERIKQTLKAPKNAVISMMPSLQQALFRVYDHVFENAIKTGKTYILVPQTMPRLLLEKLEKLEKRGCILHFIKCHKDGTIDLEDLEKHLSYRTSLVTLCLADPLLGTIQEIKKIQEKLAPLDILLHVDVTYAIGKFDIDLKHIEADFVTFSLEAINSPHHAIVIGKELLEERMFYHDVQFFDTALYAAVHSECALSCALLRNYFVKQLNMIEGCSIFSHPPLSLPNCVIASFLGCDQEALLYLLEGLDASIGNGPFQDLKDMLLNIGHPFAFARSSLSFQLSEKMTKDSIDNLIEKIKCAVEKLRRASCHL